ncbi:hypothetical protein PIIN_11076 [Serendipita indica DSM 11827]|uniref:MARVEL domain-containing protein n=1 Tax=Serendipita indica (strain DSM 11827) TaxID=1109443 RepID=G4U0J8_SERID|nr:hypothetical protein PIIN_11076 [Serendipita indica DSM 11827]
MKPWITFLFMLPFSSGVMANGGGTWHVPPAIKAATAFEIIWSIVLVGLLVVIFRRLYFAPPDRDTHAPYILLSVVTGALSISYLTSGILFKISNTGNGIPFRVRSDNHDRGQVS